MGSYKGKINDRKDLTEILDRFCDVPYIGNVLRRLPPETLYKFIETVGRNLSVDTSNPDILKLTLSPDDSSPQLVYSIARPYPGIAVLSGNIKGFDILKSILNDRVPRVSVIHYCRAGRCEIHTESGLYAFMQEGTICVESHKHDSKDLNFFGENYEGIEISFDLDAFNMEQTSFLKTFGIDRDDMLTLYENNADYKIGVAGETLKATIEGLGDLMHEGTCDRITLLVSVLKTFDLVRTGHILEGKEKLYLTKGQRKIVSEVYELYTSDLTSDIPVEEVASKYNLSAVSLNKYFKIVYGDSVHKCILNFRLQKAAQMLSEGDMSVGDIALAVGYENPSKFGTAFKKKYDLTPLEYRRQMS